VKEISSEDYARLRRIKFEWGTMSDIPQGGPVRLARLPASSASKELRAAETGIDRSPPAYFLEKKPEQGSRAADAAAALADAVAIHKRCNDLFGPPKYRFGPCTWPRCSCLTIPLKVKNEI
jgi:hypothetical protein